MWSKAIRSRFNLKDVVFGHKPCQSLCASCGQLQNSIDTRIPRQSRPSHFRSSWCGANVDGKVLVTRIVRVDLVSCRRPKVGMLAQAGPIELDQGVHMSVNSY
jgi:hypothetical protein